jgi:gliding motility-associated-like protein
MTRFCWLLILQALLVLPLEAQVCDGNLGENIFTEGDFGSGPAVVLPVDPMIAPGYIYTTQPPPNDGFYTITNNMSLWAFNFDWLELQDNSPDPNGYMMVVNASFEPGLFYEEEIEGLCDNTLYAFSADIINLIPPGRNIIKPNVSFLLDGNVVYSTGDIPENATWNTYGFTFTTDPGQTSVTLALRNNAPGGNGNDIALDNISFRACGPEALILPMEIANICEDGSPIDLEATINGDQYDTPVIQWQQSFNAGVTWEDIPGETDFTYTHTDLNQGFYYYRYRLANSPENLDNPFCYVISNEKVVRVIPKNWEIVDTLCQGLGFELGDNIFTETGIYVDSFISFFGCDSIVTLDLTILPDPGITADLSLSPPSCTDSQDGSISVANIQNGFPPYAYFLDEVPLLPGPDVNSLGGGFFEYSIQDRFGCSFDSLVNLPLPPPILTELGPDRVVNLGESIEVAVNASVPILSYDWVPAIQCEDPDCSQGIYLPTETGPLLVTVQDTAGCVASDSIFVEVIKIRKVYIPNAFTPNFDGINDYFTPFADFPNVQEIIDFRIFSRWGEMVYEAQGLRSTEPGTGWDGTFRGRDMPVGVYTYVVRVRFLDGVEEVYSGSINLMR